MSGVNKVTIIGNLGTDPDVRTMPNGDAVTTLSVATSDVWNDKNTGERKEVTEWHRIVLFRRQAEVAGQYLHKGSKVYIEGKLKKRKWQDQNGVDRYTTEIWASELQMLDSKPSNFPPPLGESQTKSQQKHSPQPEPPMDNFDDDIPFSPIHHGFSKHSIYVI